MVKGSGSVGMWSTCKVVHHVHAVGALVHQAEQAYPLHARLKGGYGGAWTCSAPEGPAPRGRLGREASGLSQYQQLARTCARAMILYAFC